MILRRMTAAMALAGVAMLAATTPALAHAELVSSNPAKNASLAAAPKEIRLTFSAPVSPQSITVTGPEGAQWTVGQMTVTGAVLIAPVKAVGPAGQYALTYKVKSEDGDDQTGTVAFTMTAASTPTAPPTGAGAPASSGSGSGGGPVAGPAPSGTASAQSTSSDSGGGLPVWVWILIIVVVLGAVSAFLVSRARGKERPTER
jgi:methionine-rich copper-binding protein CopC